MPLFRRLPKRGFSNARFATEYAVVNVEDLNRFAAGSQVNAEVLREKHLVRKRGLPIKILGKGKLTVALNVTADRFSRSAEEKIRQAGGEVRGT
jgi:large subunit ribosomal protein L15